MPEVRPGCAGTGGVELSMDMNFPEIMYAAMWHQEGRSLSDSIGDEKSASTQDVNLLNSVTDMVDTPEQEEEHWKQLQKSNLF